MYPVALLVALTATLQAATSAGPIKITAAAPPKAAPFQLSEVRLLDGPFKDGQDIAVKYLLSLEPDRLLANFRKESDFTPKAKHYEGWEARGVSGHTCGHYLSGCSLAYASTGDKRFLDRVNHIVSELAECQKANGNGYVSAIPDGKRVYAEIAAGDIRYNGFDLNGCWVPNYTMHKVFAGLRDAYRLCGNHQALDVSKALADWFEKNHAGLTDEQMQKVLFAEHGGMNETFADLYADTGDERYLKLSRRWHHKAILDPLSRGEDILPGKHANTQIPKIIGLATRYELAGDPADRNTADFFWDRVVRHHSYITGGHCDHEHFSEPDKLNDRLSDDTTETCNVYNMLGLTRHVFGWNPDSKVADFYERALLNQIRSSQHPDGRVIYNLTLKPGGTKHYQTLYDGFTCCVGTGMENHVKYGEGIYFHDEDSLWVNQFIASDLDWKQRGVKIRQETKWPLGDTTTLSINSGKPQEFTLRLRHPHWAKDGVRISVNGQPVDANPSSAGYCEIRREWKSGDRVEIRFPMSLRTEAMPDNPKRIGIFYGPTLLAADLGPSDRSAEVPVLVTDGKPINTWVKPVSVADLTFKTDGAAKPADVKLVPFFSLHDRSYTVFLDQFTNGEWAKREAEIRAERERQAKLAALTVDDLRIGEMQPERDHNVTGEKTSAGDALGRKYRHAIDGGWFSFEMKVDETKPNELHLTYWGGETGNRVFDILVNGNKITTQRLLNDKPGRFFDVVHPLPPELTRGKQTITVRLQARPGAWAGGLFGAKTLRSGQP